MTVPLVNNTLTAIRTKVRRLTASPGESTLPTAVLDEYINTFYSNDFPYAVKLDQMRSVYTFYTQPYVDQYPLDVNFDQGVRGPAYVDGIPANFFKDRQQFFNMWPRYFTEFKQSPTILSKSIIGATIVGTDVRIVSVNHGLVTGAVVTITGVGGMIEINDQTYTITKLGNSSFSLNGVNGTGYTAYTTGGTWTGTAQDFNFTISGTPFLRNEVMLGGVSALGVALNICDDGYGVLNYTVAQGVAVSPGLKNTDLTPRPGMQNSNYGNAGLQNLTAIGTVDYVTGEFEFTLPSGVALATDSEFTIRISQYQPAKPYSLLFWNNYFQIRPIPQYIHKIEIETYLTPVQFFSSTDKPILNQWWQFIALGAAIKIFEDRGDFNGVAQILPSFQNQQALVLERQSIEEVGQQNITIYNTSAQGPSWSYGSQGWY